jgi:hypothetical protein
VLRLRALEASGDFEDYWAFHAQQERKRTYGDGITPLRAAPARPPLHLIEA